MFLSVNLFYGLYKNFSNIFCAYSHLKSFFILIDVPVSQIASVHSASPHVTINLYDRYEFNQAGVNAAKILSSRKYRH